jgi:hypothetical protein
MYSVIKPLVVIGGETGLQIRHRFLRKYQYFHMKLLAKWPEGNEAAHGGNLAADIAVSDMGAMNANDLLAFRQLYGMDVGASRRYLGM